MHIASKMYAELARKTCSKCQRSEVLSDFYRDRSSKDKLSSWCKRCFKANQKTYQQGVYKERKKQLNQRYKRQYPERYAASVKNWALANPGRMRAKVRRYQLRKRKACPKWLNEEQIRTMRQMYEQCPRGHEVDHIIPVQGKTVCGLHVPWNLQYLAVADNRRKSNKY